MIDPMMMSAIFQVCAVFLKTSKKRKEGVTAAEFRDWHQSEGRIRCARDKPDPNQKRLTDRSQFPTGTGIL